MIKKFIQKVSIFALLFFLFPSSFAQEGFSNDTLQWNAARPLNWNDFKGEPIEGINEFGEAFCMNFATVERPSPFQKTSYKVIPLFDRQKSWILDIGKTETHLLYFQSMFDIYEIHARLLRKEFHSTKFGSDPTAVFQEKYNASMNNLLNEFNLFRKETKLGQDENALNIWKEKLAAELKDLEDYK